MFIAFASLLCLFSISCKKILDAKQSKKLSTITTSDDLQSILDGWDEVNLNSIGTPINLADEYYFPYSIWASSDKFTRGLYVWDDNAEKLDSWNLPYHAVYIANVVLEELDKVDRNGASQFTYNNIKGQALFIRSFAFLFLSQLYCKLYSPSADTDLGIPLRLTSNLEVNSKRSTVQQTYDRILNDLKEAADLLPEDNVTIMRPNKGAAYAALARTYLSMRDYANAARCADSSLKRNSNLMDYNTLNASLERPIKELNPENIYLNFYVGSINSSVTIPVDTMLYRSYDINDLRKSVFFRKIPGTTDYYFKGYYTDVNHFSWWFNGPATDEMYLIRAESSAWLELKDSAMADLNRLLITRWRKDNNGNSTYIKKTANSSQEALQIIREERKKELVYRGLRWGDLRRLNLEGANITLTRILNGVTYTLPPNDLRWVMLIGQSTIDVTGMQQNER